MTTLTAWAIKGPYGYEAIGGTEETAWKAAEVLHVFSSFNVRLHPSYSAVRVQITEVPDEEKVT